jgi:hypothetical protein
MSQFVTLLVAAAHEEAPIIAPPWVFALAVAGVFLTLGLLTFSYRDVANRHSGKDSGGTSSHQDEHH